MKRTFRAPKLQSVYDWFRANKPKPETAGKGGLHNAYYVGRYGDRRPIYIRTCLAYAAWAAGVDDAKTEDLN